MHQAGRRRLSREDWCAAALRAIGRGGIDAVAVETIATELSATKGSFYWHFRSRDELVEAALAKWQRDTTEATITELERVPEPAQRLKALLAAGLELGPTDRAEIALLANPTHPAAVAAVRRTVERRIGWIAEQLQQIGWDRQEAINRAALLYYLYVGHLQTAHVAPRLISRRRRQRHLDVIYDALVTGQLRATAESP